MLNIASMLDTNAREAPEGVALWESSLAHTHLALNAGANRVANALAARGIGPGDCVALICENGARFMVCYFGILKLGAVAAPLSALCRQKDIEYQIAHCGARALLASPATPAGAEALAAYANTPACTCYVSLHGGVPAGAPHGAIDFEDFVAEAPDGLETYPAPAESAAAIIFTSGTAGRPRGAVLTHLGLFLNACAVAGALPYTGGAKVLAAPPLSHTFGLSGVMHPALHTRSGMVSVARFDPAVALDAIASHGVTILVGVPTMYRALLHAARERPEAGERARGVLAAGLIGGAPAPAGLVEAVEAQFGMTLFEGYGLTECSGAACLNRLDLPRRAGAAGRPLWGTEVCIVDGASRPVPNGERGEILLRGHHVMKEYVNDPEATAGAMGGGWLRTGDVGIVDADGYVYVVDRIKDLIIRGGRNVYPREVEEVLAAHPAVAAAAVVGIPDETYGEEVAAVVAPRSGAAIEADELRAWARERLPAHAYPRRILVRPALPLGPSGKVLKRELRTWFEQPAPAC